MLVSSLNPCKVHQLFLFSLFSEMAMIAMMYFYPTWVNDACKNEEVCSIIPKYGWTRVLFFFLEGEGGGEMLQVKIRLG